MPWTVGPLGLGRHSIAGTYGFVALALAMAVLLGHLPIASYKFISAAAAVQGFYIISGFYMALVLEGKYKRVGLFYSNRLLRLMPTYFVMMAIAAAALWGLNASATGSPEIFATAFKQPDDGARDGRSRTSRSSVKRCCSGSRSRPDGALAFDATGALAERDDDARLAGAARAAGVEHVDGASCSMRWRRFWRA